MTTVDFSATESTAALDKLYAFCEQAEEGRGGIAPDTQALILVVGLSTIALVHALRECAALLRPPER